LIFSIYSLLNKRNLYVLRVVVACGEMLQGREHLPPRFQSTQKD